MHQTPANPCTDTVCPNPDCYTNADGYSGPKPYAHYAQYFDKNNWNNYLVVSPHVRPPETSPTSCKVTCANGCVRAIAYAHVFDNCGDSICNICNGNIDINERAHRFTAESPIVCVDCGTAMKGYAKVCTEHVYDNECDAKCNVLGCGYQRYNTRTGPMEYWHIYDNPCDTTCNDCEATREIVHTYPDHACAELCVWCGEKRATGAAHTYSDFIKNGQAIEGSNACDDTCNTCNKRLRTTSHSFSAWVESKEPTAKEDGEQIRACTVCGATEKQTIPAKGGLSTGGIVAIVISSVAVLGGGGFSVWWFVLRKKFIG